MWNEEIRNQVLAEALHYYNTGYAFSAPFDQRLSKMWATKNSGSSIENEALPDVEEYVNNLFADNFFLANRTIEELRENWRDKYAHDPNYKPAYRFLRNSFSVKEIWAIAMRENRTQIDYHIRKQIEQSFRKLGFERDNSCRERQGILGQQYVWRRTKNTTTEPQVSSVLLENKDGNATEEDVNDDDLPF